MPYLDFICSINLDWEYGPREVAGDALYIVPWGWPEKLDGTPACYPHVGEMQAVVLMNSSGPQLFPQLSESSQSSPTFSTCSLSPVEQKLFNWPLVVSQEELLKIGVCSHLPQMSSSWTCLWEYNMFVFFLIKCVRVTKFGDR